ncbi:MAG: N-acetylglucosamine-6-phosphate deacetylase, partial [Gammaproteobacteria bacterium]|nr:N-acetylglucosamine-6-phosphate deacetylase [Gammaproteobacteria bacterium]
MGGRVFRNGRIVTSSGILENGAVEVCDGRIVNVQCSEAAERSRSEIIDLEGDYLLPGFVDVQVNGGDGVLFNDEPSAATAIKIAKAHRAFGTTRLLPTLISDDLDKVEQAVLAIDAAVERGTPGIAGVHIEGPFLNVEKRGIHDARKLRRLSD